MKKNSLLIISTLLTCIYLLSSNILPVLAQNAPNTNVTKRRPDRPTDYSSSPSPVGAGLLPPIQPDIKQVETSNPSFFAKIWLSFKSFFANFFSSPIASTTIASPAPISSSEPLTSPDPTADWKTYNSSKFSFSIQYPSNWSATTNPEPVTTSTLEIPVVLIHDAKIGQDPYSTIEGDKYPANYIGVTVYSNSKSLDSFIDQIVADFEPEIRQGVRKELELNSLEINNVPAISFVEPGAGGRGRLVGVSNGKQVVLFNFPPGSDYTKNTTFNKILSSLKFTN